MVIFRGYHFWATEKRGLTNAGVRHLGAQHTGLQGIMAPPGLQGFFVGHTFTREGYVVQVSIKCACSHAGIGVVCALRVWREIVTAVAEDTCQRGKSFRLRDLSGWVAGVCGVPSECRGYVCSPFLKCMYTLQTLLQHRAVMRLWACTSSSQSYHVSVQTGSPDAAQVWVLSHICGSGSRSGHPYTLQEVDTRSHRLDCTWDGSCIQSQRIWSKGAQGQDLSAAPVNS